MSARPAWSEDDLALLRAVYPARGAQVAALRLRRSVRAVYVKASDLGLSRQRAWTAPEIEAARAARARGARLEDIAESLNRSVAAVRLRLRAA